MANKEKKTKSEKKPAETKGLTEKPTEVEKVTDKPAASSKNIVIAVLATILGCFIIVFGVLLSAGVIRFGGDNNSTPSRGETGQASDSKNTSDNKRTEGHDDNGDVIIDNPNKKVAVNGTKVSVKDLEFYLPSKFEAGGKNDDGAYTYNLVNDDGWAQVLVYAEKSNLSPEKFLMKISPYLDITDDDYDFNNTEWVVGENANALAYATELDGTIYAVYYSVKLDSDATGEAMQMIPKTLYMNKVYADDVH